VGHTKSVQLAVNVLAWTKRVGGGLPDALVEWIRRQDRALSELDGSSQGSPLTIESSNSALTVSLLRNGPRRLLVFDERQLHCPVERLMPLGLGKRESEVLSWVARGKTNDDIATILGLSVKTVKKHLERIFDKLGVDSRTAAAARALEVMNGSWCNPCPP
jgi:DNA-binding CsgD family transcriptional regulator